jgi:hypothetical protein
LVRCSHQSFVVVVEAFRNRKANSHSSVGIITDHIACFIQLSMQVNILAEEPNSFWPATRWDIRSPSDLIRLGNCVDTRVDIEQFLSIFLGIVELPLILWWL